MAVRRNYTTDTVTAGKFVPIGQDSETMKARLRRINQLSQTSQNSSLISGIGSIVGDSVITPGEKRQLAEEWEHIQSAYSSTVSLVEQLGINPDEFVRFKSAFEQLKVMMESILENMGESTPTDGRLQTVLEAYSSAATILQNYLTAYQNGLTASISEYRLAVTHTPTNPKPGDTIKFSASIYISGVDRTQDLMDEYVEDGSYPDLFDWSIEGTDDDSGYMTAGLGKRVIEIPSSALIGDNVTVSFSSTIVIS